jgi:NADH-ubiquinone oxidoreductase chain 4
MINIIIILIPLIGIITIITNLFKNYDVRLIGLITSILAFLFSLFVFILFDYSNIEYQFIQEIYELKGININIGIDGISIYFILLTTFISPIVILSN